MKQYGTRFQVETPNGEVEVSGITEDVTIENQSVPILGVYSVNQLRLFGQGWNLTHLTTGCLLWTFADQKKAVDIMYKLAGFIEKEFPEFIAAKDTSIFAGKDKLKKKFFKILKN